MERFTDLPTYPAIEALKAYAQWVGWRYEFRNGPNKKPTKPPVSPRTGFAASHSDPSTWARYDAAADMVRRRNLPGVGFVLSKEDGICGIDLDACRNAETGEIEAWAEEALSLAETYAEISPSGTGIRLFALGKPERALKSDAAHVEIYGSNRYLTVTGNHVPGTPIEIRPAPLTIAALKERVEELRAESGGVEAAETQHQTPAAQGFEGGDRGNRNSGATSLDEVAALLHHVPADVGYDEWLQALMAVHVATGGSAAGLALADQWSAAGSKYKVGEVAAKWRSFRANGVNGATLAALARRYGADLSAIRIAHMERDPDGVSAEHGALVAEGIRAEFDAKEGKLPALGRDDDGSIIDMETGEVLSSPASRAGEVGAALDRYDLDDHELQPGGVVSEIADWICAWTSEPIRIHAIGAALTIVGTLIARKVFTRTRPTGSHLYVGAVAPSGMGKQHPQDCIRLILDSVLPGGKYCAGWAVSMPALAGGLVDKGSRVMVVDEFADKMSGLRNRNNSNSVSAISEALRTLWGVNTGSWSPDYSLGRGEMKVERPALSFYGAATIRDFTDALVTKDVTNGLLNRFLILPRFGEPEQFAPRDGIMAAPEILLQRCRWLHDCLDGEQMSFDGRGDVFPKAPIEVPFSDAAAAADVANVAYQKAMMRQADGEASLSLYGRFAEIIKRIALVVACGRLPEDLTQVVIEERDMAFAHRLVSYSIEQFVLMVRRDMTEGWVQAQHKLVLGIIREAKAIGKVELTRKLDGRIPRRDREAIVASLVEGENIEEREEKRETGAGRPKTLYRYLRG